MGAAADHRHRPVCTLILMYVFYVMCIPYSSLVYIIRFVMSVVQVHCFINFSLVLLHILVYIRALEESKRGLEFARKRLEQAKVIMLFVFSFLDIVIQLFNC